MDWQPIETAPKDGTWVLVHGRISDDDGTVYRQAVAQYTNELNGRETAWHWQFAWYDGGYYGWIDDVSHWKPLDPAPDGAKMIGIDGG